MTQRKFPRKSMTTRANAVKTSAVQQAKTPTAVVKNRFVASGYSHYGASYARKSLIGWMSHSASADEDIADKRLGLGRCGTILSEDESSIYKK